MANTREVLNDRFIALSGVGKRQSAQGIPMLNADLDTRDKCTITREEVIERQDQRDCQDVYIVDSKIRSRLSRYTLDYQEITPQMLARWTALKEGAATAPTGAPANAVQVLSRSGTVDGGQFKISVSLEGRTVQTKGIPWNASSAQIEAALTAARMLFIHPGDVSVSMGQQQIETLTVTGTANESEDLAVTVTAAGSVALASGKTIQVAIADTDTAAIVAGKIRAALLLDADIGHATTGFFTVSGAGAEVILTAKAAAADDGTMAIAYENAHGMTGATSADTQAGVASTDWSAGARLSFQGRLAGANIPTVMIDNSAITGGGSIVVSSDVEGSQRLHEISRSTGRAKSLLSFALGWLTDLDRVEKYIDYVVESVTPNLSLEGNVTCQVVLVGPWEYDTIEESFDIPQCLNIDPLETSDCRIQIDGAWQTVDINSLSAPISDAIPTDRLSAFPFDGIDVQLLERGRQPVDGPVTASIFGSEVDPIYNLAQNERTADKVPVVIHFGFPGNRCTWAFPNSHVRFQTNRLGEAGEARYSTVQIDAVPMSSGGNVPFECEAHIPQSETFLTASV